MILMSTTTNWNPGDDLIRQGVMRLLDLGSEPIIWLNRLPIRDASDPIGWRPAYARQCRAPQIDELVKSARLFVCAGTPEWITSLEPVWAACIRHKVPIALIGIGGPELDQTDYVRQAAQAGLIRVITTRDDTSRDLLDELGIERPQFLDPAFHADYLRREREPGIVLNPRLETDNQIDFYRTLYARLKSRIRKIVVHEVREYQLALAMRFESPIWFSSDWQNYLSAYAGTEIYVGGRLHGAIPTLVGGGSVYLVVHSAKQLDAENWHISGIHGVMGVYETSNVDAIAPEAPAARRDNSAAIQADFNAHRNYIQQALSGALTSPCA